MTIFLHAQAPPFFSIVPLVCRSVWIFYKSTTQVNGHRRDRCDASNDQVSTKLRMRLVAMQAKTSGSREFEEEKPKSP